MHCPVTLTYSGKYLFLISEQERTIIPLTVTVYTASMTEEGVRSRDRKIGCLPIRFTTGTYDTLSEKTFRFIQNLDPE
jgi:hypothetical protein